MAGPTQRAVVQVRISGGQAEVQYAPTNLAHKVKNLELTPERTLRAVRGACLYEPDRGGNQSSACDDRCSGRGTRPLLSPCRSARSECASSGAAAWLGGRKGGGRPSAAPHCSGWRRGSMLPLRVCTSAHRCVPSQRGAADRTRPQIPEGGGSRRSATGRIMRSSVQGTAAEAALWSPQSP